MISSLKKNINGYFGERIDISSLLTEIEQEAAKNGWQKEVFFEKGGLEYYSLSRKAREGAFNLYISAGIHGDEPAPPLAVLSLLKNNLLLEDMNIWLCPCLNPAGFVKGTRENENGFDLNRDYRALKNPEVQAHVQWLEQQPEFDLALCLHEDWESEGFYLIVEKDKMGIGKEILNAVSEIFPVDLSETIDGFPAKEGIVSPEVDISKHELWPEAFYLSVFKKGQHYTFETSSDFPLSNRVEALVVGVTTACALLKK